MTWWNHTSRGDGYLPLAPILSNNVLTSCVDLPFPLVQPLPNACCSTWQVTANEGDARDYTGLSEEVRVGANAARLDPTAFPNAAELKNNANLGR